MAPQTSPSRWQLFWWGGWPLKLWKSAPTSWGSPLRAGKKMADTFTEAWSSPCSYYLICLVLWFLSLSLLTLEKDALESVTGAFTSAVSSSQKVLTLSGPYLLIGEHASSPQGDWGCNPQHTCELCRCIPIYEWFSVRILATHTFMKSHVINFDYSH